MHPNPMKLVTIICEAYGLEPVKALLRDVGVQGWTHFTVEGSGEGGERTGEMKEYANVQIEVVVRPEVAGRIMERLEGEFFPRYMMIAFDQDVRVIRSGKF